MKLTKNDYIDILNYYNLSSKNMTSDELKSKSEKILATKLCRCIKKVDPDVTDKSRAIAICNNSVLKKKNLKGPKFTCKKKYRFIKTKTSKTVTKRGKRLTIKKKRYKLKKKELL